MWIWSQTPPSSKVADSWPQQCGRRTTRARARISWRGGATAQRRLPITVQWPRAWDFFKGKLEILFLKRNGISFKNMRTPATKQTTVLGNLAQWKPSRTRLRTAHALGTTVAGPEGLVEELDFILTTVRDLLGDQTCFLRGPLRLP